MNKNIDEYFKLISEKLKDEVFKITDDDILTCNFDEWINYLYDKYEIIPITLYEESTIQSIKEVSIKRKK